MRILAVEAPKQEKDERKLEFFNKCYKEQLAEHVAEEQKII